AHHCGVEYPRGIDKLRFMQSLTVMPVPPPVTLPERAEEHQPRTRRASICVTEKGILPLESLVVARYQMFRAVYWQHTVRAQTAMLQFAIEEYLARGRPEVEESHADRTA